MGEDENRSFDFDFKFHRNTISNSALIYSINDIAFNPVHETFFIIGSDGVYSIGDKLNKYIRIFLSIRLV